MNNLEEFIKKEIKIHDLEPRYQEMVNVIDLDNFLELCKHFGGTSFSALTPKSLLNLIARRKICERHTQDKTLTVKQLAVMYGVSTASAYNYIREVGK